MLSYEEFEAKWNRLDRELAAEKLRQDSFIYSLELALIDLPLKFFPETEAHKEHFIKKLSQEAHDHAVNINETLDYTLGGYAADENKSPEDFKIPDRDVSEEEKKCLEETLAKMPPEQHERFIQLNNERLKAEAEERAFKFQLYDKAIERIAFYFPEIVEFSGNSIRNINSSAYRNTMLYAEAFYWLAGEYLNEEYP